ncbi:lectin C-type domain protein [Ancylostoma caninum]|uniref:Lectin C-type domain protein n=1 Tax=Ancylostoma caninum TaxID=29170 RepID=A0A368G319_ANCCA|nr:lectin C-type domain protein [Ancylostoma caninum]
MYDRSFDENFGKWKAANCSDDIKAYMCKKPKYGRGRGESGIASNVGVNAGTHETFPHVFKGYQYAIMYDSRKVRFVQARMKCEDLGAQLASIHSREEVEFLKSVVQSNSTLMEDAWSGLVQTVTATVSPLKWIDESPVDYKNFASLEPKYFEDGTYCGQIMTNGDNLSKWKVEKCDAAAYVYVCKKSASGRNGGRKGSGSEDSKLKPNTDANALFPYNFKGNKYAIITNGDEFSKWKVVNCNEGAHIFVCQARKVDGEGRGSGGGKGSGNESKEEDPDTTEPTTRRPPRGPPTLTPPLPDIPDPNPSEDPDQCSDPSVCSIYRIISEDSDSTVEEKGCYPV